MKKWLGLGLAFVGIGSSAQDIKWPPLPKAGFVVGRAATKDDVDRGHAVFVAAENGVAIGKALDLTIPQYAWFKDGKSRVPAIVVQAEEAKGSRLIGAHLVSGGDVAGFASDFELLGQKVPR